MIYLLLWLASFAQLALIIFFYFKNKSLHNLLHTSEEKQQRVETLKATNEALQTNVDKLQDALQDAIQDSTTHLPTWSVFEDRMHHEMQVSERYQFITALMLVDIDDFHLITAPLNRQQGEALLTQVATRLQSNIRNIDSASRFANDRFGLLLTQLAKPESAAIVAQRVLQSLAEAFTVTEEPIYLTACIGIAIYPEDSDNEAALIKHAEQALAVAKKHEKHSYQFYQEKIHVDSKRELTLRNVFQQETVVNELSLRYSPIFDVQTNEVLAMDVLVEWEHASLGVVQSNELFAQAEKYRKLNFIFEWLVKTSCQNYLEWAQFNFQPQMLALPFTVKQLENSQVIYRLSQTLQNIKFDPKHLLLVLRDSTAHTSYDIVEKSINMLKYLGVQFLVDSFGSGVFPITQLKNYPIALLRLSTNITADLDQKSIAILNALQILTKHLSIEIVAQDITSQAQYEKLKALGVKYMQGDYLSPPLPASEIKTKFMAPATQ